MMSTRKTEISSRQRDILKFIQCYLDEHGYPPAIRDISAGCGISSTSVAVFHLKKLEEKVISGGDRIFHVGLSLPVLPTGKKPAFP